MSYSINKNCGAPTPGSWARGIALAALACAAGTAYAAVPGITGTSFALQANQGLSSQPDGVQIYSWGYGCASAFTPTFAPASFAAAGAAQFCHVMQRPGPTLFVTA